MGMTKLPLGMTKFYFGNDYIFIKCQINESLLRTNIIMIMTNVIRVIQIRIGMIKYIMIRKVRVFRTYLHLSL